jgi:aminopeptidase N
MSIYLLSSKNNLSKCNQKNSFSYGTGFSTVSKMIDAVTTHMNSEYHKEQFIKFTKKARKLGLTSIEKSIKLAEEQINNNIYWKSRSYYKLNDYLKIFIRDMHINVS